MKNNFFVVGIDPGLSGAIAILWEDGRIFDVHDMPIMPMGGGKKNMVNPSLLKDLLPMDSHVGIEAVHAMPGNGVTAMFGFGMSFMAPIAVAATMGLTYELITPQSWKKTFNLIGKEKGVAFTRCMELYPSDHKYFAPRRGVITKKQTEGRCDAILIARSLIEKRLTNK